jgi:hypothetical protein
VEEERESRRQGRQAAVSLGRPVFSESFHAVILPARLRSGADTRIRVPCDSSCTMYVFRHRRAAGGGPLYLDGHQNLGSLAGLC